MAVAALPGAALCAGPQALVCAGVAAAVVGVGLLAWGGAKLYDHIMKAEEAADEDLESTPDEGTCTSCGDRVKELEEEANVEQKTKGKTRHGEKDGGMDQADKDFDSLNPENVKPIQTTKGPGRTGTLPDGRSVTVRPGSSDGRPTLEIRNPGNGRGTEIRYNP